MTTKTNIEAVNSGQTEREAFKKERDLHSQLMNIVMTTLRGRNIYGKEAARDAVKAIAKFYESRAAAPQGLTDDLQRRVHRALMSAHPNLAREFAEQSPAPASPSGEDAAEQADAPMAEHGYCQARANNEDCNCASACARWVPAPLPRVSEQADEAALTADDADMVWPDDDGESMFHSVDDAVDYMVDMNWPDTEPMEVQFQIAKRIPAATIRIFNITENGHEWEIIDAARAKDRK